MRQTNCTIKTNSEDTLAGKENLKLTEIVESQCRLARAGSLQLAAMSAETKNKMLQCMAFAVDGAVGEIIKENKKDMECLDKSEEVFADRLLLNDKRIKQMADGMREVAKLSDPIGEIVEEWTNKDGLIFKKIRASLGVIGVIYEARPNVTVDVVALCLKSGNAVVLRGGKEAVNSNRCLYKIMKNALIDAGYSSDFMQFIDDTTRDGTKCLLKQDKTVDVIIPRGGTALKDFVFENTIIPVIASGGGNCHIYVEKTADIEKSIEVVLNAKVSRPSVCNAVEHILVDKEIAKELLSKLAGKLKAAGVEILGCEKTAEIINCKVATAEDFLTEFHSLKATIKIVSSSDEAIDRINQNNTKHSDGIMSEDKKIIDKFCALVDSACIYVNASTRFTDGFVFGFGAEIAVSTQKLHARGPLGIKELTSEKYVCFGKGHIRE